MTLNGRYALYRRKHASFGAHRKKIRMKLNPHYMRQKYRPMTLVSGSIRFMRIFVEVPWEGVIKRHGVVDNDNFQRFR